MREILGVDSLGFLSVDGVKKIAEGCKLRPVHGLLYRQVPGGAAQQH